MFPLLQPCALKRNEHKHHKKTSKKQKLLRKSWVPHSIVPEKKIIKEDLQIGPPLDKISGDGHKNGINYEMKTLIYYKNKPFNFIQIRTDHSVNYYIFCWGWHWPSLHFKNPFGGFVQIHSTIWWLHSSYIFKIRKNCRK